MKSNDYHLLKSKIAELLLKKEKVMIAIDGRCASGKTTLAEKLKSDFSCNVLHMDDFYLPLEKRENDWQSVPAKNIDFVKITELLQCVQLNRDYQFSPYVCKSSSYGQIVSHRRSQLTIMEGSYSCHPILRNFYDFCVFLDISPKEQKERLILRNGEVGYQRFQNIWIPMEEAYFEQFAIRKNVTCYFKQ